MPSKSQLPMDADYATNSCSIGIELIAVICEAPTELQINALVELVKNIQLRHKIKYICSSDISPELLKPIHGIWIGKFQNKIENL